LVFRPTTSSELAVNFRRNLAFVGLLALGANAAWCQDLHVVDDPGFAFAEFPPIANEWEANDWNFMHEPVMPWPPVADAPGSPYDSPLTTHHSLGRACPPWRPCGPANSFGANWLFYQGAYGADFRPACQNHDDCLMNPWNSRYGCDRALLEAMAAECANSSHPGLCMLKAQKYYVGVRLFGGFVRYGAP
jgi:hypothetical protein